MISVNSKKEWLSLKNMIFSKLKKLIHIDSKIFRGNLNCIPDEIQTKTYNHNNKGKSDKYNSIMKNFIKNMTPKKQGLQIKKKIPETEI